MDFDDTLQGLVTHPSSHLVPALLGAIEGVAPSTSTHALLEALVVGIEVEATLARALNPRHAQRGWHGTGTLGAISAAVAVGRLLGATQSQIRNALAIAASSAAGLRANFGTPVKALHAGHAARAGLEAAILAVNGLEGAPYALEHAYGFFRTYNGHDTPINLDNWDVAAMRRCEAVQLLTFKPYPCCGEATAITQAAVELQDRVRQRNPLEQLKAIVVRITPFAREVLEFDRPTNADEARFSAPYCVATALARGSLTSEHFQERALDESMIVSLMERSTVVVDDALAPHGGALELSYNDGATFELEITEPKGHCTVGLSDADAMSKFEACTSATLGYRGAALFAGLTSGRSRVVDWLELAVPPA
jgi:2-methylcitrate dehydratase PrpD